MARINLLPWREQLREERKKQFVVVFLGILIIAGGLVLLASQRLNAAMTEQNTRNEFIRTENAALDLRIKEIRELKTRRQQLVDRMKIIRDLQGNRPIVAHIFDQLVRTLPDGVYFTALNMTGSSIFIEGVAESNNLVSSLMRNQENSAWLTAPNLLEVKVVSADKLDQSNTFKLTVQQTEPSDRNQQGEQK
ncbi:MAG: PilN domain-containing protein [Pseudomonas sp.]|jgi:type IV pilus assembly protein PilN|nr:PilN domain-containing protein [Pseudomonas sp.]NLO53095.1 PilN domain-containing protein [Gammaproteobacteria bacterium]